MEGLYAFLSNLSIHDSLHFVRGRETDGRSPVVRVTGPSVFFLYQQLDFPLLAVKRISVLTLNLNRSEICRYRRNGVISDHSDKFLSVLSLHARAIRGAAGYLKRTVRQLP